MSEAKDSKAKRPMFTAAAPPPVPETAATPEPETAAPVVALTQPALPRPQGAERLDAAYRGAVVAVGESQGAIANGLKALALEMTGLAGANLTAVGDSTTALLRTRNFADAVEIQLGFARRGLEAMLAGSARLSEIGVRMTREASRPIVAPTMASARFD